jgi:K+ transporter
MRAPDHTLRPLAACPAATAIVASQALISASFQIVKQAIAQTFFPRFNIKHTNKKHEGQIYISVRTDATAFLEFESVVSMDSVCASSSAAQRQDCLL